MTSTRTSFIGKGDFGVRFADTPEARKAVIQHVYVGPYSADVKTVSPTKVAGALMERMFR